MLAVAMIFSIIPAVKAEAAQTHKMTLYVGETLEESIYGTTVKSVKSSKKSVVSGKKSSTLRFKAEMEAKKAGKATVTVKTTGGTYKFDITVKKLKCDFDIQLLPSGAVMLKTTNNTNTVFDTVAVRYTLKNVNGETIESDTAHVRAVIPGQTAYTQISSLSTAKREGFDAASSTVEVIGDERNLSYTYKYSPDSLKVTNKTASQTSESQVSVDFKYKNTSSKDHNGQVIFLFYDDNGELIDMSNKGIYLSGKDADSSIVNSYGGWRTYDENYQPVLTNFGSLKIVKNVYTLTRKK